MERVVTAVLGGGQGTRLWPLTRERAKPAVPLGGKFRLIDIPLSNSLHAGIERIFVLTQFNSASLHRHIAQTYRFDVFRGAFVHILAAEQSLEHRDWYQGTADAVRRNLKRLTDDEPSEVLILSGDQLYQMDLRDFVLRHRRSGADLTIAVSAVPKREAGSVGVLEVNDEGRIVEFAEKPTDAAQVSRFVAAPAVLGQLALPTRADTCLASMGIYVFRTDVLRALLEDTKTLDFGREVVPDAIHHHRVMAYGYAGYWRDIGTIRAFHEASLELARPDAPLDLYTDHAPIYTRARFLAGTRIEGCVVRRSVINDGGMVEAAHIEDSIIGIRARIGPGTVIERSVVMGATRYVAQPPSPPPGIGRNCVVRNAILDLNTSIGDEVRLINQRGLTSADEERYAIRDGIIVVVRGAHIPSGTVI